MHQIQLVLKGQGHQSVHTMYEKTFVWYITSTILNPFVSIVSLRRASGSKWRPMTTWDVLNGLVFLIPVSWPAAPLLSCPVSPDFLSSLVFSLAPHPLACFPFPSTLGSASSNVTSHLFRPSTNAQACLQRIRAGSPRRQRTPSGSRGDLVELSGRPANRGKGLSVPIQAGQTAWCTHRHTIPTAWHHASTHTSNAFICKPSIAMHLVYFLLSVPLVTLFMLRHNERYY